jgi:hypothetical protein
MSCRVNIDWNRIASDPTVQDTGQYIFRKGKVARVSAVKLFRCFESEQISKDILSISCADG